MSIGKKIGIIIGAIFLILVIAILAFALLQGLKKVTNEYVIEDIFSDIYIESDAEIKFMPSREDNCKVVLYESPYEKHSVIAENNKLSIERYKNKAWYQHIAFEIKESVLTVYLPQNEYNTLIIKARTGDVEIPSNFKFNTTDITVSTGDVDYKADAKNLKITASTGDIEVKDVQADSVSITASTGEIEVSNLTCSNDITINVSTGDVEVNNLTCNNLTIIGDTSEVSLTNVITGRCDVTTDTGDISLVNVLTDDLCKISADTGEVNLNRSDAGEFLITTDTGDVIGSILSEKIFIVRSDTGDIDVPRGVSGGVCEITTDTGDIKIYIAK